MLNRDFCSAFAMKRPVLEKISYIGACQPQIKSVLPCQSKRHAGRS